MSQQFQAPRGTEDILPEHQAAWRAVYDAIEEVTTLFGYRRIDTPIFEASGLFEKGSGDTTDIVEKEMYVFEDRGGESLALTPEGTPAICRAYLEHGMGSWPQPVRLFTTHPMFRYDRPQKGRYRQHTQFDCEVIGSDDPIVDAEVIEVLWRLFERLGVSGLEVRLGSLDDPEPRRTYVQTLKDYYRPHLERLSADSQRRFDRNPLRLLDSKDEKDLELKDGAPKLIDRLSSDAAANFYAVQSLLTAVGIPYRIDPLLVRGLDYYNRTVFEIVPQHDTRAQGTVGAGGRYDGLMELLGGPHTPAIGFGSGIERMLIEMERCETLPIEPRAVDVFVVHRGEGSNLAAVRLARALRNDGISAAVGESARSMKSQMRTANAAGAAFAAIIGEDEMAAGTVVVKDLHRDEPQQTVPMDKVAGVLHRGVRT
jgi:histidyl-tRNA synthetase